MLLQLFLLTSFIIGRNSAENVPEQAQETVVEFPETYIDTTQITSVAIRTEGLELNFRTELAIISKQKLHRIGDISM